MGAAGAAGRPALAVTFSDAGPEPTELVASTSTSYSAPLVMPGPLMVTEPLSRASLGFPMTHLRLPAVSLSTV